MTVNLYFPQSSFQRSPSNLRAPFVFFSKIEIHAMKVLFGANQKQWCHCSGLLIFQKPSSNILWGMSAISQSLVLYEVLKKYENDEAGAQANLKQILVPTWLTFFPSLEISATSLTCLDKKILWYISELTSFKCCECSAFLVFNIYSSIRTKKCFLFSKGRPVHVAVATRFSEAALQRHCF